MPVLAQREVIVLIFAGPDLARQRRRPEVDRPFHVGPGGNGDAVGDRVDGRRRRDLHPAGVRDRERPLRAPGDPRGRRVQIVQRAFVASPGRIERGRASRAVIEAPVSDQVVEEAGRRAARPALERRAGIGRVVVPGVQRLGRARPP